MMRELNSVLAVRNVEKQRKRELREKKKQGGALSPNYTSVNHNQPPDEQKLSNILETASAVNSNEDADRLETSAVERRLADRDDLESKPAPTLLPMESELPPGETKLYSNVQRQAQ